MELKQSNSTNSASEQRRKLIFLIYLPVLIMPFLALGFYALGGGTGPATPSSTSLNLKLPEPAFPKDSAKNKLEFYERDGNQSGDHDSTDLFTMAEKFGFSGARPEDQTLKIHSRIDQINREIASAQQLPPNLAAQNLPTSESSGSKRLEQLVNETNESKADPEISQLDQLMDKILELQNPRRPAATAERSAPVENLFAAIPAQITSKQLVRPGGTVELTLSDTIRAKDILIPKGHLVYSTAALSNQRMHLKIKTVRMGNSIIPVDWTVYGMDGIEGILTPEAIVGEQASLGAEDALRAIQFSPIESSIATELAGAGIDAARSLASKKIRQQKIRLKAGIKVLLRVDK